MDYMGRYNGKFIDHLSTYFGMFEKANAEQHTTLKYLFVFLNTLDCDRSWLVRSNQE